MTNYSLAISPDDKFKAQEFLASKGLHTLIEYPTILATQRDKISCLGVVGVISTTTIGGIVQADPLIVDCPKGLNKGIIVLGLLIRYEEELERAGVEGFHFYAWEKEVGWINMIRRYYKIEPYAFEGGRAWFSRKFEEKRDG